VSIDLDELIRHANELEPLPASATRLAALLSEPDWDLPNIVAVIELDATLTARLLRVANSVSSGSTRPITTTREAALRMGAATVAAIATGIGVRQRMLRSVPAYAAREDSLWRHSIACALAVQGMARHCKIAPPAEAFTAALLHDVGKLLLCQTLSANLIGLLRSTRDTGRSELEAEWEVLEVTHPELGGMVVQQWRLPPGIVQAVALHHAPLSTVKREHLATCRAVQLADWVAKAIGASIDGVVPKPEQIDPIRAEIGVSEKQFSALAEEVSAHLESTLAIYGE
jgi:HD-like signal output (HDOD) protein